MWARSGWRLIPGGDAQVLGTNPESGSEHLVTGAAHRAVKAVETAIVERDRLISQLYERILYLEIQLQAIEALAERAHALARDAATAGKTTS